MTLFGFLERSDARMMSDLPNYPVMTTWWAYMDDIMATHPDGSPVGVPLADTLLMA